MRNHWKISGLFLLALAGCGGAAGEDRHRPEAAPLLVALASPAGSGAQELQAGRPARARAQYEAALARDPEALAPLNDLAATYAVEDRADAARSLLDEVVSQGGSAEQLLALVNLGQLYALDGYLPAAQAYLEAARAIDAARPEPAWALALLADARGEPDRALALAREAQRLDDAAATHAAFVFAHPEERLHLEALAAEARGEPEAAAARWRELRGGRFPALSQAAQRHLEP